MRRIIEVLVTTAFVAGALVQSGSTLALSSVPGGGLNCSNPAPQPIVLEPQRLDPQLPGPGYPVTPPCVMCRAPSPPGCWMVAQEQE